MADNSPSSFGLPVLKSLAPAFIKSFPSSAALPRMVPVPESNRFAFLLFFSAGSRLSVAKLDLLLGSDGSVEADDTTFHFCLEVAKELSPALVRRTLSPMSVTVKLVVDPEELSLWTEGLWDSQSFTWNSFLAAVLLTKEDSFFEENIASASESRFGEGLLVEEIFGTLGGTGFGSARESSFFTVSFNFFKLKLTARGRNGLGLVVAVDGVGLMLTLEVGVVVAGVSGLESGESILFTFSSSDSLSPS